MTPNDVQEWLQMAKQLPADDVVYKRGDVKSRHRPLSTMHCEQVLVARYGKLYRRRFVRTKWQPTEEIGGRIDD